MNKPNFFIVGVPKSGTTAMSEYLGGNPSVFMSHPKEPHFFADDFPMYKKNLPELNDYLALFNNATAQNTAIGEASVYYLYSKDALNNILKFNPAARIIVMLRNPVELVQSMHAQLLWTLDENEQDFETAWGLQKLRKQGEHIPEKCREPAFLQYGDLFLMGQQIERLFNIFPSDQLKIILFDDFKKDTVKTYQQICEFLSVPDLGRTEFSKVNARKSNVNEGLAKFTQRPPQKIVNSLKQIKKMLGIERLGLMKYLQKLNAKEQKAKRLTSGFRSELHDFYKQDVELLEKLISKDLAAWKEVNI